MKKLFCALLLLALLCGCSAAPTSPTPTPEVTPVPETTAAAESAEESTLTFSTTDMDGNTWDESVFAGHTLTMLNFWEPWCGPCVGEMPDLETLSKEYAEQGVQLLGIYSTEQDAADIRDYTGVSYPLLRFVPAFAPFQTGYVPTTVFVDENGQQVGETVVGAKSYEDWAALIEELLA